MTMQADTECVHAWEAIILDGRKVWKCRLCKDIGGTWAWEVVYPHTTQLDSIPGGDSWNT